jgi:hypothetical protein
VKNTNTNTNTNVKNKQVWLVKASERRWNLNKEEVTEWAVGTNAGEHTGLREQEVQKALGGGTPGVFEEHLEATAAQIRDEWTVGGRWDEISMEEQILLILVGHRRTFCWGGNQWKVLKDVIYLIF